MHQRIAMGGIFTAARPLVGMVHLAPLPGSPGWAGSLESVTERATADAGTLVEAGFDGLLMENFGDIPFHPGPAPPETIAAMAVAVAEVKRSCPVPIGVNVLRNDAAGALAICAATGADFIRVNVHTGAMLTDQGWIRGEADRTLRTRRGLAPACAIFADVLVKHAVAPPGLTLEHAARDTWERGLADVLILSGEATGSPTPASTLQAVRKAVPDAPLWIGSGLNPDNCGEILGLADGAIIGSAVQRGGVAGTGTDPDRARRLIEAARSVH